MIIRSLWAGVVAMLCSLSVLEIDAKLTFDSDSVSNSAVSKLSHALANNAVISMDSAKARTWYSSIMVGSVHASWLSESTLAIP